MRALLRSRLYRVAAAYTLALWLAGFAWLNIVMAAIGRFYGGAGLAADIPYCAATLVFALALQFVVLATMAWRPAPRHAAIAGAAIAAALLSGAADTTSNYYVARHFLPAMREWATGTVGDWLRASFLYSWVYFLNVAVVMLVVATEAAREQARLLAQAREAAQVAKLTMLRYQLNPHFLFNTLNAISSLVLTRQNEAAERMIDRLAAFLRATNASDAGGFVTLADELSTIEDYLDVEAVRFGDRMRVVFDVAAGAGEVLVPSFLLQPIVENAIKYAVAPRQGDGEIRIAAHEAGGCLRLRVEDDGAAQDVPGGGTGIGLANVRERLRAFYGDDARCDAGRGGTGFVVAITLPTWRRDRRVQAVASEPAARVSEARSAAEMLATSAIASPPIPSLR